MISTTNISNRFVNPVGFSNGCAELTLKKPPPLVPSSLIASWEATGPIAIVCAPPLVRPDTCRYVAKFWIDPWKISTSGDHDRHRQQDVEDVRIRSCQKFPSDLPLRPMIPRISAIATQMPTAAEAKFCTVSPAIWLK